MIIYTGKQIRIEKGYTVRGLAEKAQIAPSTISKIENGNTLPDLSTLDQIAVAMEINPFKLVQWKLTGEKMNIVKIHDKRCINGYRIEFFDTDVVTDEIVRFVKENPKAYWIGLKDKTYTDRDSFLEEYS